MHATAVASFNLVDEPWLPVRAINGVESDVSLLQCLCKPMAFTSLNSTNPVEYFGLLRLLLAVLHRALPDASPADRARLLTAWPSDKIEHYLAAHHSRFELFDLSRPFMQVAGLRKAELAESDVNRVVLERSEGNTKLLFDHGRGGPLTPAQAARALVGHLQFVPGGLVKALRTAGSRGSASSLLMVAPVGQTLRETFALSLLTQSPDDYSKDIPPWEADEPSIDALAAGETEVPLGPVQRYTWLSRAVLLGKSEDGLVRHILYAEGRALQDGPVPDPMAVTLSNSRGPYAMKLDVDRTLWRELDSLVSDVRGRPPLVIENAVSVFANTGSYDPIDLISGGLLADQAKLEMWRLEERRISPQVLGLSGEMTATVCNALELVEKTGAALDSAIFQLAHEWLQRNMSPRKDDVRALFTQLGAMPGFWHRLEPLFWNFVQELEAADTDEPFKRWQSSVKDAVRHTWTAATMRLGASGRALEVAARSEKFLWRALAASSSA